MDKKPLFEKILKSMDLKPVLFPENTATIIRNSSDLLKILEDELKFWSKYGSLNLGSQVYSHVNSVNDDFTRLFQKFVDTTNPESVKSVIQQHVSTFSAFPFFSSKSAIVSYMEKISDGNREIFLSCINCAYNLGYYSYTTPNTIRGAFHSFAFLDMQKNIDSSLKSRTDEFAESARIVIQKGNDEIDAMVSQFQLRNQELNEINAGLVAKSEEFQTTSSSYLETQKASLDETTKIYTEAIRVEGPAEYWDKFKRKYQFGAALWIVFSIASVSALVCIGNYLLNTIPDKLFTDKVSFENTLKWAIVFLLITSMLVYLTTTFVKLALSALHLSRDANERLQLTHQFLALLKEGAVAPEERKIVLQALFARAESGLLKNENGPSFPDGALSQILKGLK